ncbi:MAG: hypothetical protein OXB96_02575 [Candidatus Kaiserbacteria bacterium]|nr:hypothetical protein [Candidatus Kaiserbacteria bacterium]
MFSIFGTLIGKLHVSLFNINNKNITILPGDKVVPEVQLEKKERELCKKLGSAYRKNGIEKVSPRGMFLACKSLMQDGRRKDIYSIAQMAHSLREMLYPFWGQSSRKNMNRRTQRKGEAVKEAGSVHNANDINKRVGLVYGKLTKVAHHRYDFGESDCFEEFLGMFEEFKSVLRVALQNQIDIHNQIDEIL